jgi:hypothetical protein
MTNENNPNPKRLAGMAETDTIRRLLDVVMRRDRKSAPALPVPTPALAIPQASAVAFVGDNVGETVAQISPPPVPEKPITPTSVQEPDEPVTRSSEIESPPAETPLFIPPVVQTQAAPMRVPLGALSFGEFLDRINWHNHPEGVKPLPLMGVPEPPGYPDTIESVLSVFAWDDE